MIQEQMRLIIYKITFPSYLFILLLLSAGCASQKKATRQPPHETKRELRRLNTTDNRTKKIIGMARAYTGTPYRWGGTTRSGMDCSGLLFMAFQAGGVALPRTSSEQSKIGRNVSLYELRPGDLVFFAAKKNPPPQNNSCRPGYGNSGQPRCTVYSRLHQTGCDRKQFALRLLSKNFCKSPPPLLTFRNFI